MPGDALEFNLLSILEFICLASPLFPIPCGVKEYSDKIVRNSFISIMKNQKILRTMSVQLHDF